MHQLKISILLLIPLFSVISIASASSQETIAKIVDIAYPKVIPEARTFNLTVSIENFGNTTETFLVRIVRMHFFSIQKEILILESSVGNVTFELKLLLSGDLRIEVFLQNQLMDSLSIFLEVPAPETDVGLLMIELIQAEITAVGVTLAALAIFATLYMQVKNRWLGEKLELIEKLKKQKEKSSKRKKRIIKCTHFLLQGEYNECLRHFLDTTLVRKTLSKIVNLEKEEKSRSNFENVRKSTIAIAFVLLIAVSYGFAFVPLSPSIIDAILFLYPHWGGRDVLIQLFFFPLSLIILTGVFYLIYENYWRELGRLHRLLIIILTIVPFFVAGLSIISIRALLILLIGFSLGIGLSTIFYLVHVYLRKHKRKFFSKESTQIKRLKENLRKLHGKSSTKFEKEKDNLSQRFNVQLEHFEFAFKLIKKSMASKLRGIEAEYSLDLISDKRYQRLRKNFDSVAKNAETLISKIQINPTPTTANAKK